MNNTTPSRVIKVRPGFYVVGDYRILKAKSLGMTFYYVYEHGTLKRNVSQDRSAKPFTTLQEATLYTMKIGA